LSVAVCNVTVAAALVVAVGGGGVPPPPPPQAPIKKAAKRDKTRKPFFQGNFIESSFGFAGSIPMPEL
jgi:hypothetical protein